VRKTGGTLSLKTRRRDPRKKTRLKEYIKDKVVGYCARGRDEWRLRPPEEKDAQTTVVLRPGGRRGGAA